MTDKPTPERELEINDGEVDTETKRQEMEKIFLLKPKIRCRQRFYVKKQERTDQIIELKQYGLVNITRSVYSYFVHDRGHDHQAEEEDQSCQD